jgi:hypothetical protein
MSLMLAPAIGLIALAVAMVRRAGRPVVPVDDVPARLLRGAVGLLSAERVEWGEAMRGELDHIDGRARRWRFALGCVGATLVLPPWGRTAEATAGVSTIAFGGAGIYAGMAIHFRLGVAGWVAAAVQGTVVIGLLLACSVLLRRSGVAVLGLLGGLVLALTTLNLSGFSFLDQINPDTVPWHPWVITVVAPFLVGAMATLCSADPVVGKRIARLAGISGCLGLYLYWNIAVAVIGGGGPYDQDGGGTLRGTISDRLGNNIVLLLAIVITSTSVGWGGASAAGAIMSRLVNPDGAVQSAVLVVSPTSAAQAVSTRSRATAVRFALIALVVTVALALAMVGWFRG